MNDDEDYDYEIDAYYDDDYYEERVYDDDGDCYCPCCLGTCLICGDMI